MHTKIILYPLVMLIGLVSISTGFAQATQTVRGIVTDQEAKYPLPGVNVVVMNTDPLLGAVTDPDGQFEIQNVPVGRISLQFSYVGYENVVFSNLTVVSAKELVLDVTMLEGIQLADEIVITAESGTGELNNELVVVSGRTFSVEETERFAGSRNDVARMASNFAGVSGANDGRNDIIIRGNSPSGMLWRLEGIDIPSPNHYGSFGSTGGPVSILNNNTLASSDFITGAFPANYGNTVSGVFDLNMRRGNYANREYLAQIGFNGFELGAEGPFKKGGKSTYLGNFRYSTLGVFDAIGIDLGTGSAVPEYYDGSFKLDFPTKKAGRFSVYGIGGASQINLLGSETDFSADNADLFGNENEDIFNENKVGVLGLNHVIYLSKNTFLESRLATTYAQESVEVDSLVWSSSDVPELQDAIRYASINNQQTTINTHVSLTSKLSARSTLTAGVIYNHYFVNFADSTLTASGDWFTIKEGNEQTGLVQGYANWQYRFSDRFTGNFGLHGQYFSLNDANAVEPRIGLRYTTRKGNGFSLGAGIHNQLQPLPVYFTNQPNGTRSSNYELDFTRSFHLVAGYDRFLTPDLKLTLETYYQWLDQVPVESFPSTFSMLNTGADFGTPDEFNLVNEGNGRNYGLEITLEKYFSRQYYALLTTSLFNSEYKGSDGEWRNTAFNGRYVVNLLAGKEFKVGKKDNVLVFDAKMTTAGGRYYTPVDVAASMAAGEEVLDESRAFAEQYPAYFRLDLKASYRMNRKKVTHEFSLDVQNVTNRENVFANRYNRRTGEVTTENQLGLFPVPQYRLYF